MIGLSNDIHAHQYEKCESEHDHVHGHADVRLDHEHSEDQDCRLETIDENVTPGLKNLQNSFEQNSVSDLSPKMNSIESIDSPTSLKSPIFNNNGEKSSE